MRPFVRHLARPVARWAEESQRRACSNARVASTSLTEGRRERDEVRVYVEHLLAHREPRGDVPHRASGMW